MSASFDGAEKFIDAVIARSERMKEAQSKSVMVGVLGKDGSDLVTIAAANEFGAVTGNGAVIPARPFLRTAMHDRALVPAVRKEAAAFYAGKQDIDRALNRIGLVAAGLVKKRIASNIQPANAASTIAKKGSSKTLIDTGRLRQSISWQVVNRSRGGVDINSVAAGTGLSKKESSLVKKLQRQKLKSSNKRKRLVKKARSKVKRVSKKVTRSVKKVTRSAKKAAKKARKSTRKFIKGKRR